MTWGLAYAVECDRCSVEYAWYIDHPDEQDKFLDVVGRLGWRVDDDQEERSTRCPDCNPDWPLRHDGTKKP